MNLQLCIVSRQSQGRHMPCPCDDAVSAVQVYVYTNSAPYGFLLLSDKVHSWWETQSTVRLVDAKCIFFSITWAFSGTPYSFGVNVSLFLFWWVQWQVTEFERLVRQRSAGSLEAAALKQTIAWKGRKLVFQTRLDKTQIMQPKGLHW